MHAARETAKSAGKAGLQEYSSVASGKTKKRDAGRDVHGGREFWNRGEGKVSRGGRYDKSTGICWFKGTVILNLHLANYTVVHVQHASIFLVQWC